MTKFTMKILFASCLLLLYISSFACLNIYGVDINGNIHFQQHYFHLYRFDDKAVKKEIAKLEKLFSKKKYDFRKISDYAAYLLMAGKHEDGLTIFRQLQGKYPAEYALKANLAVAYELNGKMDSALYWQKLASIQDPNAHGKSEWIHIRILEARIALQKDSNWLQTHDVTSIKTNAPSGFDLDMLMEHFLIQVDERLPFSYKEDKVFGKVFFEFGNIYENTSIYRAYYCYAMAAYFNKDLEEKTIDRMNAIRNLYGSLPAQGKKNREGKEKYPPEETEVNSYLAKLDQRKKVMSQLQTVNIDELFANLSQ